LLQVDLEQRRIGGLVINADTVGEGIAEAQDAQPVLGLAGQQRALAPKPLLVDADGV